MPRLARRVESLVPRRAREYGGKAQNLASLARAGLPVPAAFALPVSAFEAHVEGALAVDERLPALLARPASEVDPARLEAIAARVRETPPSIEVVRAVQDAFADLAREGARGVAVRSSSTFEDQGAASAAGLHVTRLNVRDADEALEAVLDCWASVFAPRVLTYLRTLAGEGDAAVGVVLQAMVPAQTAGVLFTMNPLTGDAGELVIDAAFGLGSSVVDGRVSPDTLRIDKASGRSRDRVIGDKTFEVLLDDAGGVREVPVSEERQKALCLDEATVHDLVALGLRIEEMAGGPRDVEWAVAGGRLYVLQARPITVSAQPGTLRWARRPRDKADRDKLVWSNVNVGEALPGVATPLTWSILSSFSELGFRRAFGALGCTVPRDAELVGSFRGRIYLNLTEFMGILSQVPGIRARTLLSLGGGGGAEWLEEGTEKRSSLGFLGRLPLTAARFAREAAGLAARVEELEATFAAERRRIGNLDPRILPPAGLDRLLRDVELLLDESGAVMLTAYGNLLAAVVVLHTALRLFAREDAERLQRDLLSGLADVDSAAPGLSLWHIAEMAQADGPARAAILARPARELRVPELPEGPTRRALANFLEAYGHRGAREAEIAEPRWSEDPTLLFATLQIQIRREQGGESPLSVEHRQRAVRERAEESLARRVPIPGRLAIRHLLALVQRFMRLRERLRGHVTEVLGMYRKVALDASRRITQREPGAGPDAAFYLTLDELHAFLRGELREVETRVRQRRRQVERDRSLPDPEDTFVGHPSPAPPPPPDTSSLRGLSASSGVAQGRARVLSSPSDAADLEDGEVLVLATADVGVSPLFLVASGVVTDLGGPLSHASVVLREYGVPAVVNVKVGTRVIQTGDLVRVDGDAGVVQVLERAGRDLEGDAPRP